MVFYATWLWTVTCCSLPPTLLADKEPITIDLSNYLKENVWKKENIALYSIHYSSITPLQDHKNRQEVSCHVLFIRSVLLMAMLFKCKRRSIVRYKIQKITLSSFSSLFSILNQQSIMINFQKLLWEFTPFLV